MKEDRNERKKNEDKTRKKERNERNKSRNKAIKKENCVNCLLGK